MNRFKKFIQYTLARTWRSFQGIHPFRMLCTGTEGMFQSKRFCFWTEKGRGAFQFLRNTADKGTVLFRLSLTYMSPFKGKPVIDKSQAVSGSLTSFRVVHPLSSNRFPSMANIETTIQDNFGNRTVVYFPKSTKVTETAEFADISQFHGITNIHSFNGFHSFYDFLRNTFFHTRYVLVTRKDRVKKSISVHNLSINEDESYVIPIGIVHNCRCRVRGRMEFQVEGLDFDAMRTKVKDFLQTKEWKMSAAQGWGVNRCDTAQIFTADQMYIRKFPEHSASYLKKLTADRWKLPTVQKMKQDAETDMPRVEHSEQEIWDTYSRDGRIRLTDYDGRTVVIGREQFFSHTSGKGRDNRIWLWDAMLDTLQNPDEVWLNNEIEKNAQEKAEELNTYCLMKFYRDEVVAVNYRIEGEELVLKTWYIMQTNLNKTLA